ncbi:hypothetical protein L6452_05965 [Arctium lappa]|uniref:Uncharacterized protein n=1 Tax=Arctium lappa TaxID=4217 RepID=A0ACB9EHJ1_ARCLA|nr:hypothetical protein L6452_05965 [Arctium lappa]
MRNIDLPVKSDDPNLEFEVVDSTVEPTDPNITYGLNLHTKKDSDSDPEPKIDIFQSNSSIDNLMLNKLRNDLDRLSEDRGMDEFQDLPVEDFAAALLKGKEKIGFVDDLPMPQTNDGNNRAANTKKEGVSKEEKRQKIYVGKDVRVVGGNEAGLRGRIMEVIAGGDQIVLKLSRSQEEVTVRVRDVIDLGSIEEERCLKKLKDVSIREKVNQPSSSDRKSKDSTGSHNRSKRSREIHEISASSSVSWLNSHIREKDMDNETTVVRDADTHALLNVRLEQIAEYVGDPDDIGY